MDNLSIILLLIAIAVLTSSIWGVVLINKHITRNNKLHKVSKELSSERFYELKARQDYIIASSTIIFAVLTFIGYSSIKEIKNDLNKSFAEEKLKLDSLYNISKHKIVSLSKYADSTNLSFLNLSIEGKDLKDSMRSSLALISILKGKLYEISEKEIIRQNIFIVDNLHVDDFPKIKFKQEDYHQIYFDKLTTITGQKLPKFNKAPSIMLLTSNGGQVLVDDINKDGFKIFPYMWTFLVAEDSKNVTGVDGNLKFAVWISINE